MSKKRTQPAGLPPDLMEALGRFIHIEPPALTAEHIAGELEALPRRAQSWLAITEQVNFGAEEALLSLVVCPESPEPLLFQPMDNAEDLLRFIVESMGMGQGEGAATWQPYVPAQLLVSDAQLAFAWGNLLREAGLKVKLGVPPELEGMVREAAQTLQAIATEGGGQALPFLSDKTPQDAKAFLDAFDGFMKAKPWKWLDDRPLFVQWQDESGQPRSFYAVIMGHNGEEFGFSIFERWTDYLESVLAGRQIETFAAITAQGGREAVNLARTGEELADEDWAFVQRHLSKKGRKRWSGGLHQRIGLEGSLPVRYPLAPLTALLELLAENAPTGRNYLTSFKRKKDGLRVVFPATAREELSREQSEAWIRLRLNVTDRRFERADQKTLALEIVAQGNTLMAKVFSGKLFGQLWQSKLDISKWSKDKRSLLSYDLPDRLYRLVILNSAMGSAQTQLYIYSRSETNPTLAQVLRLAEEEGLYLSGLTDRFWDEGEYEPIRLEIERVGGPLTNADAEEGGVQMRWLE